jgi:hypothetical protein
MLSHRHQLHDSTVELHDSFTDYTTHLPITRLNCRLHDLMSDYTTYCQITRLYLSCPKVPPASLDVM